MNKAKLSRIVEAKEREIERMNYQKYFPVYKVALDFLSNESVLLYGGTAIHEIVGGIYENFELPDIDILAKNAEAVARKLVNYFRSHKRNIIASMSPALHKGTWKVHVDGLQVADITSVSATIFDRLNTDGHNTSLGIRTVSPDFLRMSLHTILSQPYDAHRWEKAFDRFLRMFQIMPVRVRDLRADRPVALPARPAWPEGDAAMDRVRGIDVGWAAIVARLPPQSTHARLWATLIPHELPHFILLEGSDLITMAERFVRLGANVKRSAVQRGDEQIGRHIELTVGGELWATLMENPTCVSYVPSNGKTDGLVKASIHTLIRIHYALFLSKGNMTARWIAHFLERVAKNNDASLFATQCLGHAKGLVTLRRERFERVIQRSAM